MTNSPENIEVKQEPVNSPIFDFNEEIKLISSSFEYTKDAEINSPERRNNQFSNLTPSSKGLEGELEVKLSDSTLEISKHLLPFSTKPNLGEIINNSDNILNTIKDMESLNISTSIEQETTQCTTPEVSNEAEVHNATPNETDLIPSLPNMLTQLGFQFDSTSNTDQNSTLTVVKQEETNPFSSIQNSNNNSNIFFNNTNSGRTSPNLAIAIKKETETSALNHVSRNGSPYSPAGPSTLNRATPTRSPPVLDDSANMYGFDLLPREYQSPSQSQLSSSNHNSINYSNANSSLSNTPRENSPSSPNLNSSRRRVINSSPTKRAKTGHIYSKSASNAKPQSPNTNNNSDKSLSSVILSPPHLSSPGTSRSSFNTLSTLNGASNNDQISNSSLNQQKANDAKSSDKSTAINSKNISLNLSKGSNNTNVEKKRIISESKSTTKETAQKPKQTSKLNPNNPIKPISEKSIKPVSKSQVSKGSTSKSTGSKKVSTEIPTREHKPQSQSKFSKDSLPEDELTISETVKPKKTTKNTDVPYARKTTPNKEDRSKRRNRQHKPQDCNYNPPATSRSGRTLKPLGNFWENAVGYEIKPMPKLDYPKRK
ncbi:hypothetical protein CONCODRAFT_77927 [Conidiobolus coronatus NRRL 28638]|uniref:Uncharacterized protein n=1 Tax=Conidiobolus coronatus (strain ATCC 28846 / CBS 209.66 / NRRL 28638) TaxID=796925 RepID=A0A137PB39_CONC2|nr:hypothetical protein CONCODRAFT_77927 [Conidiobolus coronatus NRRL 28638]|eukprot:KXN72194.1 hypothetical protein CONCODRAFT_77927 [Conidiobolus coronatus NRRL 28638]